MSTKIYNAYKFDGTIEELFDLLKEIRSKYQTAYKDKIKKLFSGAVKDFILMAEIIQKSVNMGYNVITNPDGAAMIYPYQGNLYVQFFGMDRWRDLIYDTSDERLTDFHYQNNTDMPEDISEEEWEERYETWHGILTEHSSEEDGFSFIMIPSFFAWDVAVYVVGMKLDDGLLDLNRETT